MATRTAAAPWPCSRLEMGQRFQIGIYWSSPAVPYQSSQFFRGIKEDKEVKEEEDDDDAADITTQAQMGVEAEQRKGTGDHCSAVQPGRAADPAGGSKERTTWVKSWLLRRVTRQLR